MRIGLFAKGHCFSIPKLTQAVHSPDSKSPPAKSSKTFAVQLDGAALHQNGLQVLARAPGEISIYTSVWLATLGLVQTA